MAAESNLLSSPKQHKMKPINLATGGNFAMKEAPVESQVWSQVMSQVRDQVWSQVTSQVYVQVSGQVYRAIKTQARSVLQ